MRSGNNAQTRSGKLYQNDGPDWLNISKIPWEVLKTCYKAFLIMKISVVVSILFTISGIFATQSINAADMDLGPRPHSGIYDQADVFSDQQEAALAERLRVALETNYLEVYIATYRIVKGETIAERAARLRNAWTRNPFGMVVIFDDSVSKMSFVGSKDLELFVSSQQLRAAFQRAGIRARRYLDKQRLAGNKPASDVLLLEAIDGLLNDPVLTERMTQPEPFRFTGAMLKLLLFLIVLVAAAGMLVVIGEKRFAKAKTLNERVSHFPRTHMPIRLGAIYSGGVGATLNPTRARAPQS